MAGLCESRWQGRGEFTAGDHCFIWSGPDARTGLHGVALAMSKHTRRSLISWNPINDRLLSARFLHLHGKMTAIVAYAPTNVADDTDKDTFFDQLHQVVSQAPPHDIIIILTDANATFSASSREGPSHQTPTQPIGTTFADNTTNDNGKRLLLLCHSNDLCITDTWFPRKQIHHWTWYSPDGRTRKAIDHIIISRRWRSSVTNCRVFRGAQLGNTDHRLLVAQLRLKLRVDPSTRFQPCIVSSKLRDPTTASAYCRSITNAFTALADDDVADWETFKLKVNQSAQDVLGRSRSLPKQPWISQPTLDIIDRRREARLRGDMPEYRRLNAARNAAIAADRERYWGEEAERLESAAQGNYLRQVFNMLRQARAGPRIKTVLVKDANGSLITTETDCLERWKEHFSHLLHHPPVPTDPRLVTAANSATPNPNCKTDPVTTNEVRVAIKTLKNRKAPGICAITAELLKEGGESMVQWLTHIINHVWVAEQPPTDWTRGIILPFWKRKGDKLVCSNHRGITLLSIPAKLFTRILLTRALPAIRSHRRPQQAGFMPYRSTTDHISALRLIVEKVREFRKNQHLYIAFIDLKAAFDTVDHTSLWNILKYLGVPPKITTMFQRLYNNSESCVRVNGKDSEWFPINSGVRQGCVAAPDLFNCVIDHLMTQVCEQVTGVSFGNLHLADLEYADDTTLFSNSLQHLSSALTIYQTEAAKLGLQVSWQKTKLMYIGDGPSPPPLSSGSDEVEFVSSFIYLGSTITNNGDLKPEIDRRRALAAAAMQSLWRPLWRHHSVSHKTKLRIYNTAVLPILLYGAESWPLNKTLAKRIDGFDSRALRTIMNISWHLHVTNADLRKRTLQPPASRLAAQRRIRWLGHLLRLPLEHPTRAIFSFDPAAAGWKRPRGKPHTRWLDVIKKDLQYQGLTLEDAADLAQDRGHWRALVKLIGSTHCDDPVE